MECAAQVRPYTSSRVTHDLYRPHIPSGCPHPLSFLDVYPHISFTIVSTYSTQYTHVVGLISIQYHSFPSSALILKPTHISGPWWCLPSQAAFCLKLYDLLLSPHILNILNVYPPQHPPWWPLKTWAHWPRRCRWKCWWSQWSWSHGPEVHMQLALKLIQTKGAKLPISTDCCKPHSGLGRME